MVASRGMATEAQLKARIEGTKNIHKITKSMKMVSAAKLRGDQTRLKAATPFASWASQINGAPRDLEDLDVSDFPQKNLFVLCTTDKGLCGGVNSILSRMTRQVLNKLTADGKEYQIVVLGDKGRAQLQRQYGDKFVVSITDRVMPYTFDLASCIANEVKEQEVDQVHILYNSFRSAISYIPSVVSIDTMIDAADEKLTEYDVTPRKHADVLLSFYEYTLATQIFHCLMQNATSEQSSRMGAMENASKNAAEMIEKLTLQYNRARQARITTELIEIISGASALEG